MAPSTNEVVGVTEVFPIMLPVRAAVGTLVSFDWDATMERVSWVQSLNAS